MTRSQRAQVVELLKCAVDVCVTLDPEDNWTAPSDIARESVPISKPLLRTVRSVCLEVSGNLVVAANREAYIAICLEAAARVENEEWP